MARVQRGTTRRECRGAAWGKRDAVGPGLDQLTQNRRLLGVVAASGVLAWSSGCWRPNEANKSVTSANGGAFLNEELLGVGGLR